MKHPFDHQTIDAFGEPRRKGRQPTGQALTAAERAKRYRDKRRQESANNQRAVMDLRAPELAVLAVALDEFSERWRQAPTKADPATALRAKLPTVDPVAVFPGDSAWLPIEVEQRPEVKDWPAHSSYQSDLGFRDPLAYRQTPYGQPEVDALVKPGDQVWTNYDSGPYRVISVTRYVWKGLRNYSLTLCALNERKPSAGINELVAVDGRLRKLFANNMDEVYVVSAADLAAGKALPEPVRQLEEERAEKNGWYQEGRRLEKVVAELRAQLSAGEPGAALSVSDLLYLWRAVDSLVTLNPGQLEDAEVLERLMRVFGNTPWWRDQGGLAALGQCSEAAWLHKEVARGFDLSAKVANELAEARAELEHCRKQRDAFRLQGEEYLARIRGLEQENAMIVTERGKAFAEVDRVNGLLKDVERELALLTK